MWENEGRCSVGNKGKYGKLLGERVSRGGEVGEVRGN